MAMVKGLLRVIAMAMVAVMMVMAMGKMMVRMVIVRGWQEWGP